MDQNTEFLFQAVLTPHRSLSPRGFIVFMALIGGASFSAGLVFYSIGAWPITGFFGLDVLLVYLAFKLNYRSGRNFELVELCGPELKVHRVEPSGREENWVFNPYWARVNVVEQGPDRHDLSLTSHGRKLVFGRFLTLEEKLDFAAALGEALRESREAMPAR